MPDTYHVYNIGRRWRMGGFTAAEFSFMLAQFGRALRGDPLLWCDWTWEG